MPPPEIPNLVESIIEHLRTSYVFPDRALRAAGLLRERLAAEVYDLPLGAELCELVSSDLFEATADKHLRLIWHDSPLASRDETALVLELRETFRRENYGIRAIELMRGNVGYAALTIIPEASEAGEAIDALMRLVQHTEALILDLREARGGAPDGVALLCSYFFPDGSTRLSDLIEGPAGPLRQYWTAAYLPGPRYLDRPVYLLTSGRTFSGAEALAYDLQALGRAIVVGEATRGGAHPSEMLALGEGVELRLPVARSVNPLTGGNWEGVGVQPAIATPAEDALEVAHRAVLKTRGA